MAGNKTAVAIDAATAANLVRSGHWIDYGFGLSQPDAFDAALARRGLELADVKIRSALTLSPRRTFEADPEGRHFQFFNWHFSAYDRAQHDAGRCNYIPMNFGEAPDYYRRFIDPIDVVCLKTAPRDAAGYFNLGCSTTYLTAMLERARVVIVEVCGVMPRVAGPDNGIHESRVDFVIDGAAGPLPCLSPGVIRPEDRAVARLIAGEIDDGACLQIGIGGMPNAVCSLLRESGVRDLGVHTEMLVDGVADLIEAGIVTNARKQLDAGVTVFSFAVGSTRLYSMIDRNPAFAAHAVDYTNLPSNIARNDRVVSINNTTQIDLQGQAASESAGFRHVSGTGGQLQFVRGAYASRGGKSFICLASTYEKNGVRESRIVTTLTRGSIVTTPRTDTMYVVTEFGMVNLKGRSVAEAGEGDDFHRAPRLPARRWRARRATMACSRGGTGESGRGLEFDRSRLLCQHLGGLVEEVRDHRELRGAVSGQQLQHSRALALIEAIDLPELFRDGVHRDAAAIVRRPFAHHVAGRFQAVDKRRDGRTGQANLRAQVARRHRFLPEQPQALKIRRVQAEFGGHRRVKQHQPGGELSDQDYVDPQTRI